MTCGFELHLYHLVTELLFSPQKVQNFDVAILRQTGINVTRLLGTVNMRRSWILLKFHDQILGMSTSFGPQAIFNSMVQSYLNQ